MGCGKSSTEITCSYDYCAVSLLDSEKLAYLSVKIFYVISISLLTKSTEAGIWI